MTLDSYLRVLRRRWFVVLISTVLGAAAGGASTLLMTTTYQSSVQLFVATSVQESGADLNQGSLFSQQRVQSYADIVKSQSVLQPAIAQANLDTSVSELASRVTVSAPIDTVILNISVVDGSPTQAADAANAIAASLIAVATALEQPSGDAVSPVRITATNAASPNRSPVSPSRLVNGVAGGAAGLATGYLIALLMHLRKSNRGPDGLPAEVIKLNGEPPAKRVNEGRAASPSEDQIGRDRV